VPRLRPVGEAAVAQIADIKKGKFAYNYKSAMSLLLIDFTFLEGRDGELVDKELAVFDSHRNRVSSYAFKRPYSWEEVSSLNARINQAIDHGCNWNDGDVLYSELETVLQREASCAIAFYCFGPRNTQFIIGLMERTVIDITQLGCPPLADISLQGISCTFACQKVHTCLCFADSLLAEWLNLHILNLQYAKCPTQPAYYCFPDDRVTSSYILFQRARNNVRLRLPD